MSTDIQNASPPASTRRWGRIFGAPGGGSERDAIPAGASPGAWRDSRLHPAGVRTGDADPESVPLEVRATPLHERSAVEAGRKKRRR